MREALYLLELRNPEKEEQLRTDWGRQGIQPPIEENRRKLEWLFNLHVQRREGRIKTRGARCRAEQLSGIIVTAALLRT